MQTNSKVLNVDSITPEHINRIREIITKHFCGIDENEEIICHGSINYRDENYHNILRCYDENNNLVFQERSKKPSKFVTFYYQSKNNTNNNNICIDWDGRFTYFCGSGDNSIELENTLSSIPFLIEFTEYIKWIDVLND